MGNTFGLHGAATQPHGSTPRLTTLLRIRDNSFQAMKHSLMN